MKKYMIIAALPMLMLGGKLNAESKYKELNEIIKDELVAAQKAMHVGGKPELELVADALGNYSQKEGQYRQIAIDYLVLIRKAVQECNDAQYTGWWHQNFNYLFYGHPDLVKNETRPALEYVDNILKKKINAQTSEIGTANNHVVEIAAGIVGAAVLATGTVATIAWWNNNQTNMQPDKTASTEHEPAAQNQNESSSIDYDTHYAALYNATYVLRYLKDAKNPSYPNIKEFIPYSESNKDPHKKNITDNEYYKIAYDTSINSIKHGIINMKNKKCSEYPYFECPTFNKFFNISLDATIALYKQKNP